MLTRYFLPFYLLAYVFAAFFWRSYQVKKRTGVNPVTFKGSDSAHDYVGRMFKLLFAMVFGIVVIYSFIPSAYEFTLPVRWLESAVLGWIGFALLLTSLLWTVIAQAQMGDSWRIGVDTDNRTALVKRGIFRISRNPIFFGMTITLLGLFFLIPSAITLLTLVLGIVLIGVQVRLEEEHLRRLHGEVYEEYCRQVRRWL